MIPGGCEAVRIRLGSIWAAAHAADYPADPRGHSCLLLGLGQEGRPAHVVCSPKVDYLAVITAYLPDPAQWSSDFRDQEVMMTCPHCRGILERSTAPFRVDRGGYHVQWDALPAWVCKQCGRDDHGRALSRSQSMRAACRR